MPVTKSVAARIPMEEYLKFQQEAANLKMSMNEYMIMRIYKGSTDAEVKKAKAEAEAAKKMALEELEKAKKEAEEIKAKALEESKSMIEAKIKEEVEKRKPSKAELLLGDILSKATNVIGELKGADEAKKDVSEWGNIATEISGVLGKFEKPKEESKKSTRAKRNNPKK